MAKTYKEFISEANQRVAQRSSKNRGQSKKQSKDDGRQKGYVFVGKPATSKSTHAELMDKNSGGNTTRHELDLSRRELGKPGWYYGKDLETHHKSGIEDAIKKGKDVVQSNTNIPRQHRNAALDHLRQQGLDAKAILMPTSAKAAQRRNRKRPEGGEPGKGRVPQRVMNSMQRGMEGNSTFPRSGTINKKERKEFRNNYKELHRQHRFTKPNLRRHGLIK
jgi:uncharacterized membrane protein